MRTPPDRPNVSCLTQVGFRRISAWHRRVGAWIGRASALLVCSGLVCTGVLNAANPAPRGDTPPSPLSVDGGFTRETLQEFDAPEPVPFAAVPTVAVDDADQPAHFRHRRQVKRHRQAAQSQPQVVVVKAAPRRNPVESFVYWWNGWVVRTFHTRNGTVLLDKIGAKT